MTGIATGTALLIGSGLTAGGSVASSILGSNAATSAAQTQAQAAEQNAQMQAGLGNEQESSRGHEQACGWIQPPQVKVNFDDSPVMTGGQNGPRRA